MRTRSFARLSVMCLAFALLTLGCGRLLRRPAGSGGGTGQPIQQEMGSPRAILVIDSTQSVMSKWDTIKQATQAFCKNAARNRDFDLAIIKLDSFPANPTVIKNSEFTEARWNEFEEKFKSTGDRGEGTNQVQAMEEVLKAAEGDGTTIPESVVLLYFSDMLVDQPTDKRVTFKNWEQFQWKRLKDANIQSAVFYVIRQKDPKISNASRAAYKRQEKVLAELKEAIRSAQVNAQFINDAEIEDQLGKGRFTGPRFD